MMRRALTGLVLALASRADAGVFSCDEAGVLGAIAAGGGPHTFSCAGPTTVVTSAELVISQSVELDGGGLLTLSGGNAHRVIRIPSSALAVDVSLRNLVLRDGLAPEVAPGFLENGGCIQTSKDLTLENVEIYGCEGRSGGAIYTQFGSLTAIDSSIHGNRGTGAIYRPDDGSSSIVTITRVHIRDNVGAGISTGADATITDSTISGNIGGGIGVGGNFGGLATIRRSTISNNIDGGGLIAAGGFAEIFDSTFAGNLPVAIHVRQVPNPESVVANVVIHSSTLVGNGGTGPSTILVDPPPPPGPHSGYWYATFENNVLSGNPSGSIISNGGNVAVQPNGCLLWVLLPTDRCVSAAALNLGKLGPHGGPTWTVPLRAPSVAIDGAPGCTSATDQRGVARPQGVACDIGAFEWDGEVGSVPALPPLGAAELLAMLALAGVAALRARLPA